MRRAGGFRHGTGRQIQGTGNRFPSLARNGADFEFFRGAQSTNLLAGVPGPVIGYFGAIADWIDLDLVSAVAALRPHYSFVLIGQVFGRDMSDLESLPNVYLLGNQRYELIPSFLADFDACTIPFLLNQVTRATDPVKVYEYLSQGKPVIATDMAELAQCGDLIYIGKDPEDFARKIRRRHRGRPTMIFGNAASSLRAAIPGRAGSKRSTCVFGRISRWFRF